MLKVQVITSENIHLFSEEMKIYFDWRHMLSDRSRRWCARDECEGAVDQFDHADAFHLLGYRNGEFVCGTRLMPSSGPTLLREVYPQLARPRGVPHRPEWADWTRMFTIPSTRGNEDARVADAMCCAVMEFCLSEGVHWVGGVQEAYWMPLATSLGWEIQALGLPEVVDGTSVLAAFTGVSEAALESAQTTTGITTPQIVHLGPRKPFLPTTVAAATNIERAEPKLISNGQNADLNQFRAELEALERLCRYVTLEAAGLELEEAERLASAAAATIRERIENLIAH